MGPVDVDSLVRPVYCGRARAGRGKPGDSMKNFKVTRRAIDALKPKDRSEHGTKTGLGLAPAFSSRLQDGRVASGPSVFTARATVKLGDYPQSRRGFARKALLRCWRRSSGEDGPKRRTVAKGDANAKRIVQKCARSTEGRGAPAQETRGIRNLPRDGGEGGRASRGITTRDVDVQNRSRLGLEQANRGTTCLHASRAAVASGTLRKTSSTHQAPARERARQRVSRTREKAAARAIARPNRSRSRFALLVDCGADSRRCSSEVGRL